MFVSFTLEIQIFVYSDVGFHWCQSQTRVMYVHRLDGGGKKRFQIAIGIFTANLTIVPQAAVTPATAVSPEHCNDCLSEPTTRFLKAQSIGPNAHVKKSPDL